MGGDVAAAARGPRIALSSSTSHQLSVQSGGAASKESLSEGMNGKTCTVKPPGARRGKQLRSWGLCGVVDIIDRGWLNIGGKWGRQTAECPG